MFEATMWFLIVNFSNGLVVYSIHVQAVKAFTIQHSL